MLDITLLTVGKLKESFYIAAVEEYAKRLSAYCRLSRVELAEYRLPDKPSQAQIENALEKEAAAICGRIPRGAWVCVLTPEGKLLSSEALAATLSQLQNSGRSSLCFILGSSYGLSPRVKSLAELRLSMSPMTFPHHLARVMLLEQLYRAETILAGSRYHK